MLGLLLFTPLATAATTSGAKGWQKKRKLTIAATEVRPRLAIGAAQAVGSLSAGGKGPNLAPSLPNRGMLAAPTRGRSAKSLEFGLSEWEIQYNDRNGTPTFMSRSPANLRAKSTQVTAAERAHDFIVDNRALFRIREPRQEFEAVATLDGPLGNQHVCFRQTYQGLRVWAHDLVVHLRSGEPYAVNGRYAPTPSITNLVPAVTAGNAIEIVESHLRAHTKLDAIPTDLGKLLNYDGPSAELGIWIDPETQNPHLAWQLLMRPNWRERWFYVVAAGDGTVLDFYNGTVFDGPVTGRGVDVAGETQTVNVYEVGDSFVMIDASRATFAAEQPSLLKDPHGAIWTLDVRGNDLSSDASVFNVISSDNSWDDPVAVSAHHHAGVVFQYFFDVHDRRGIDNQGGTVISIVHVTEDNQPMDNAFWNGVFTAYGDGDVGFRPFAAALDVVAHEMTHGVIERTVNLEYRFQSGALNESFADVFGAMVDRDDWTLAEDIANESVFASGVLRDMQDPHNGSDANDFSWQPAHMDEFVELEITEDNGGVHINSGIPNRACFLVAEALGREKTEQVYYRILEARYLNSRSNFVDLRLAALRATADLFGESATEIDGVAAAFDRVGIVGSEGESAPPDRSPVDGEQWIAVVNGEPDDSSLFLVRPQIDSGEDVVQLTTTQVFTGSGNPVSVSDDGSIILFVDSDNFIRFIFSDGTGEEVISENGDWSSIALSPDGRRLAATSVFQDTTIFIFDLQDSERSQEVTLYNPTTQDGVKADVTLYADALDWNLSSEFIIYDAFNSVPQAGGDSLTFWSINLLDVDNEIIFPLFPALPEGLHTGNPSFGQTNDNVFAFDLYDEVNDLDEIWAGDLFSGATSLIEDNGSSIGYPRYSPDDTELLFQRFEEDAPALRRIAIGEDKITPESDSEPYASEGQLPTWFTIGSRPETPTAIEEIAESRPDAFRLDQNFPNPFNPETAITYRLPAPAKVRLTIYDVTGGVVRVLDSGFKPSGTFNLSWSGRDATGRSVGSGVYFYRLEVLEPGRKPLGLTRKMTLLR
jgi:Zn-dependent metalloprotease